ncbi:MAG: transporter substrate-binding domain-containing protein [Aestuariivita sp.]|nr:transporter substrate-binding domain-containing protein [Aestuariivita sp.]
MKSKARVLCSLIGHIASVSRADGVNMLGLVHALGSIAILLIFAARPSVAENVSLACMEFANRPLNVGFYTSFAPISYSKSSDVNASEFQQHLGYEADLLSAFEEMANPTLSLKRHPISEWSDIWLRAATPQFDIIGGGITILESRMRDIYGQQMIRFTSGHVAFRQSLLVRKSDADRFASYQDLRETTRVGVIKSTTGEARMLEIVGLIDDEGHLAPQTLIETDVGSVVADGTDKFKISAAASSPTLTDRRRLVPPVETMPQVIYLDETEGEDELLLALKLGDIDVIARGEIGNRDAARKFGFHVSAIDSQAEYGGFAIDFENTALLKCVDERMNWLTDHGEIGYGDWLAEPTIFLKRADLWNHQ